MTKNSVTLKAVGGKGFCGKHIEPVDTVSTQRRILLRVAVNSVSKGHFSADRSLPFRSSCAVNRWFLDNVIPAKAGIRIAALASGRRGIFLQILRLQVSPYRF
ncbi:MAG: hypothetical protein ACK526_11905 [Planctomyces sp.]